MKIRNTGTTLLAVSMIVFSVLACKSLGIGSSPTATFKAFYEAQKNKDVPAMKKTLSKSSLALVEKTAKLENKSVDDSLKEGEPMFKSSSAPETRNEKIDGDNATLEVQDEDTKKWSKVYFVKEEKNWKIALDKTIEELFKNLGTP